MNHCKTAFTSYNSVNWPDHKRRKEWEINIWHDILHTSVSAVEAHCPGPPWHDFHVSPSTSHNATVAGQLPPLIN